MKQEFGPIKLSGEYQPTGHTGMDFPTPPPWRMTDSGFIIHTRGNWEDTPIFLGLVTENNGILFADLSKRGWD